MEPHRTIGTSQPAQHYSATLHSVYNDLLSKRQSSSQSGQTHLNSKVTHVESFYEKFHGPCLEEVKYYNLYKDDWRLSLAEEEILQRNGFVVSESLGTKSFGEAYLSIYNGDLPVYITADSILQCWHHSYDKMLEDLEQNYLAVSLKSILDQMLILISTKLHSTNQTPIFKKACSDSEFFLLTALNLLHASKVSKEDEVPYWQRKKAAPPPTVIKSSSEPINKRVSDILTAVEQQQLVKFELFGRQREMDFTQFKPRGHYEKSATLQRYFKCMMWLGRVDLRIAGGEDNDSSLEELACSLLMLKVITASDEAYRKWLEFDSVLQSFIGSTDSVTFRDIKEFVLIMKGIEMDDDVLFTNETLQRVQEQLLKSEVGKQLIMSHIYASSEGGGDRKIPRSWTFMGQRFTVDGWVFSQLVFPKINQRLIPSGIEVAYAAMSNNHCAHIILDRMRKPTVQWRDYGLEGAFDVVSELEALQQSVDCLPEDVWNSNLYTLWLKALRTLSNPASSSDAKKYPRVMRSKEWADLNLNSQLASWAQLRHDTILYAKQSYSAVMTKCDYPSGYVDPRLQFWDTIILMGKMMNEISQLTNVGQRWSLNWISTMERLKKLVMLQHEKKPFSEEDSIWLKRTAAKWYKSGSGGGWRRDGWYQKLFYENTEASELWDALIADVHTAPPSPDFGFHGTVVSEAVGNVDMLVVLIDSESNMGVYAGPVFSHFESLSKGIIRYSDTEWKEMLKSNSQIAQDRPEWTKTYLVTGNIKEKSHRDDDESD